MIGPLPKCHRIITTVDNVNTNGSHRGGGARSGWTVYRKLYIWYRAQHEQHRQKAARQQAGNRGRDFPLRDGPSMRRHAAESPCGDPRDAYSMLRDTHKPPRTPAASGRSWTVHAPRHQDRMLFRHPHPFTITWHDNSSGPQWSNPEGRPVSQQQ